MAQIRVATAGWGVPREFASRVTSEGTGLEKYASALGATEINSTFWRRHRPSTFERWRDTVPESFRFAVKMPRTITHEAALAAPRALLAEFFADIRGLGPKLGPILVQLPASDHFDARRVAGFFRALRSMHAGSVACEPRHGSWYGERASEVFERFDVARVVADPPRPSEATQPAGSPSLRYVRWHGSPRVYWSAYGGERLQSLARAVEHEPNTTQVWCVFDNTASGAAFGDALCLRELLSTAFTKPVRLRRSRAKGSHLVSPNGLPVTCVTRPGKWGNPFAADLAGKSDPQKAQLRALAVQRFQNALLSGNVLPFTADEVRRELRGQNLACWCPLDGPCHADALLELANGSEAKP